MTSKTGHFNFLKLTKEIILQVLQEFQLLYLF